MDFDKMFEAVKADAVTLGKSLGDPSLPRGSEPALALTANREIKGAFGAAEWMSKADGQAGCAIHVMVADNDVDADAIFGAADTAESTAAGPILHPAKGQAWLKYTLTGAASAGSASSSGPARLAFSGKANVALGAYRAAPLTSTLAAALSGKTRLPFVLDAADIRSIGVDQASFITVGGTLAAKLQFNWADVLTGPIDALQGLVPEGKPLNFAVDTKAGLSVALTISDSFRLVFTGRDSDYVSVALNRANSNAYSVRADATATIRFEKPDMARALLANLAAQLLGTDRAKLDSVSDGLERLLGLYDEAIAGIRERIANAADRLDAALDAQGLPLALTRLGQLQAITTELASTNPGRAPIVVAEEQVATVARILDELASKLSEQIGAKLDALLAALGLPSLVEHASAAGNGLLERLDKLEQALSDIARKRIALGLSFEYRRVATDASLFKAKLRRNHPDFEQWHKALLGLDLARVLDAAEPSNADVELELFLHQKSTRRSVSLGLDLGSFYTDKDVSTVAWTEATRMVAGPSAAAPLQVERRHALKGSRSRLEKVFGTPATCRGQFDADFLAVGTATTAGTWRFALSLVFASSHKQADQRWLRALADYAVVWGVVPESESAWLLQSLVDAGAIGSAVNMEVSFTLGDTAFANKAFLDSFAKVSDAQLCDALAVALPVVETYAERLSPSRRIAAYQRVLQALLGAAGVDLKDHKAVGRYVARHLPGGSPGLGKFEAAWQPATAVGSVADTIKRLDVLGPIREFKRASALGALVVGPGTGSAGDRKLVATAFKGWDLAWRDRFLLRWQVALLRALAQAANVGSAASPRLKVTIGKGGKARIFTPAP